MLPEVCGRSRFFWKKCWAKAHGTSRHTNNVEGGSTNAVQIKGGVCVPKTPRLSMRLVTNPDPFGVLLKQTPTQWV